MSDITALQPFLDSAVVDPAVFALRPDYRAALVAVRGIDPSAQSDAGAELIASAEASARQALSERPVETLPHVAAWREAYRTFGAKPQRTRNSLEALLRRAEGGLPRVNALTNIYNAISVLHQIPLGGEDLDRYEGPPRLIRATGEEPFDTTADGGDAVEYPTPGEVTWCDARGVTCRRWNWRQGRRTQLTDQTTAALFILDALEPVTNDALLAAAVDLQQQLRALSPGVESVIRLVQDTPQRSFQTTNP